MKLELCEISALHFIHLHCFYRCYIFPFSSQLKCIWLPLTTLKLSLQLHILTCNCHMYLFFQHLSSFSSSFVELLLKSQGWQSHGRCFSSRWPLSKLRAVLSTATILSPGLSCVWSANSLSQLLLSLYLPFFTSSCFMFRAMMLKAEYGYQKSCTNQTCNCYTGIINWI